MAVQLPTSKFEMAAATELIDCEAIIAEFEADAIRSTMVLPHMTTGQRKDVKKALEQYPDMTCESYGFGKERKLHLFKSQGGVSPTSSMRGSNIVDVAHPKASTDDSQEPIQPLTSAALAKNTLQCVMDGPVCKLDLSSIDGSTEVPSSCPSPASTFRRGLPSNFRLPPGLELEVQNTFIHYKNPQVDQRQVQSMPHCMFRQCLLEEALLREPQKVQVDSGVLAVGTEVVIEGLSKCPAFNGLRGTLQSLDEESGRYNILLATPSQGHKTAKVKRENLRIVPGSVRLFPEHVQSSNALKLTSLV